jgi:hypothetical protein
MFLTPPATVTHLAIEAQRSLSAASFHFELKSTTLGRPTFLRGNADYRKDRSITLEIQNLIPGHQTKRVYLAEGSRVIAYDDYADERLRKSVSSSQPLSFRLASVAGPLPDPVSSVVSREWISRFFGQLGSVSRFSVKSSHGGVVLYRPSDATAHRGSIRLVFNSRHLLTGFTSIVGTSSFVWSIRFTPQLSALSIPNGAPLVNHFRPHLPMPRFANEKAKEVSIRVLRSIRKIKPCEIVVQRSDRKAVIFWDAGKILQKNPSDTWAYDGKNLMVRVGKNFYRGKANHADVLDYLAQLTNGEESFSRSFLVHSNPLEDFFAPNATVRLGTMTVKGIPSTILEIEGPGSRSSIVVKDASDLPESVSTDTLDGSGKVILRDMAEYRYLPLPARASLFELEPANHVQPKRLPKNALRYSKSSTNAFQSYRKEFLGPSSRPR